MIARRMRWAVLLGLGLAPGTVLASSSGLHEVDHDMITQGACPIVVVHANAAIDASLRADDAVAHTIARLRAMRDDDGELALRAMHADVARFAASLDEATTRGIEESERLLAVAGDRTAAAHPGNVRGLALALASAFGRDRAASERIAGLPETLALRAIREAPAGIDARALASANAADSGRTYVPAGIAKAHVAGMATPTPTVSTILGNLAGDLDARERDVSNDESRAQMVLAGAVSGC